MRINAPEYPPIADNTLRNWAWVDKKAGLFKLEFDSPHGRVCWSGSIKADALDGLFV